MQQFQINDMVFHARFGKGVICDIKKDGEHVIYAVDFGETGKKDLSAEFAGLAPWQEGMGAPAGQRTKNPVQESPDGRFEALAAKLEGLLCEYDLTDRIKMGKRWIGGEVVIKPGTPGQDRVIPIDKLFHKIVLVRDKLRVLEQNINAHPGLSDFEKIEMQKYITKIYGSLTTFNFLFAEKDDYFTGDKGAE